MQDLVSCPRNTWMFRRRSVGCFSRRERRAYLDLIRKERATRKNSQLAAARRVAIKMGRRQGARRARISKRYVTDEQRSRRPIFISTKHARISGTGHQVIRRSWVYQEFRQFSGRSVQQSWLRGFCDGSQDFCEQCRAWPPCRGAPRKDSVLLEPLRHRPKQLQSAPFFAAVSSRSERPYYVKCVGLFVSCASQRIWCLPYSQGLEKGHKLSPG